MGSIQESKIVLNTKCRQRSTTTGTMGDIDINSCFYFTFTNNKNLTQNFTIGSTGFDSLSVVHEMEISRMVIPNFLKTYPPEKINNITQVYIQIPTLSQSTTSINTSVDTIDFHQFSMDIRRSQVYDREDTSIITDNLIELWPVPGQDRIVFNPPVPINYIAFKFIAGNEVIKFDPDMMQSDTFIGPMIKNGIYTLEPHKMTINDNFLYRFLGSSVELSQRFIGNYISNIDYINQTMISKYLESAKAYFSTNEWNSIETNLPYTYDDVSLRSMIGELQVTQDNRFIYTIPNYFRESEYANYVIQFDQYWASQPSPKPSSAPSLPKDNLSIDFTDSIINIFNDIILANTNIGNIGFPITYSDGNKGIKFKIPTNSNTTLSNYYIQGYRDKFTSTLMLSIANYEDNINKFLVIYKKLKSEVGVAYDQLSALSLSNSNTIQSLAELLNSYYSTTSGNTIYLKLVDNTLYYMFDYNNITQVNGLVRGNIYNIDLNKSGLNNIIVSEPGFSYSNITGIITANVDSSTNATVIISSSGPQVSISVLNNTFYILNSQFVSSFPSYNILYSDYVNRLETSNTLSSQINAKQLEIDNFSYDSSSIRVQIMDLNNQISSCGSNIIKLNEELVSHQLQVNGINITQLQNNINSLDHQLSSMGAIGSVTFNIDVSGTINGSVASKLILYKGCVYTFNFQSFGYSISPPQSNVVNNFTTCVIDLTSTFTLLPSTTISNGTYSIDLTVGSIQSYDILETYSTQKQQLLIPPNINYDSFEVGVMDDYTTINGSYNWPMNIKIGSVLSFNGTGSVTMNGTLYVLPVVSLPITDDIIVSTTATNNFTINAVVQDSYKDQLMIAASFYNYYSILIKGLESSIVAQRDEWSTYINTVYDDLSLVNAQTELEDLQTYNSSNKVSYLEAVKNVDIGQLGFEQLENYKISVSSPNSVFIVHEQCLDSGNGDLIDERYISIFIPEGVYSIPELTKLMEKVMNENSELQFLYKLELDEQYKLSLFFDEGWLSSQIDVIPRFRIAFDIPSVNHVMTDSQMVGFTTDLSQPGYDVNTTSTKIIYSEMAKWESDNLVIYPKVGSTNNIQIVASSIIGVSPIMLSSINVTSANEYVSLSTIPFESEKLRYCILTCYGTLATETYLLEYNINNKYLSNKGLFTGLGVLPFHNVFKTTILNRNGELYGLSLTDDLSYATDMTTPNVNPVALNMKTNIVPIAYKYEVTNTSGVLTPGVITRVTNFLIPTKSTSLVGVNDISLSGVTPSGDYTMLSINNDEVLFSVRTQNEIIMLSISIINSPTLTLFSPKSYNIYSKPNGCQRIVRNNDGIVMYTGDCGGLPSLIKMVYTDGALRVVSIIGRPIVNLPYVNNELFKLDNDFYLQILYTDTDFSYIAFRYNDNAYEEIYTRTELITSNYKLHNLATTLTDMIAYRTYGFKSIIGSFVVTLNPGMPWANNTEDRMLIFDCAFDKVEYAPFTLDPTIMGGEYSGWIETSLYKSANSIMPDHILQIKENIQTNLGIVHQHKDFFETYQNKYDLVTKKIKDIIKYNNLETKYNQYIANLSNIIKCNKWNQTRDVLDISYKSIPNTTSDITAINNSQITIANTSGNMSVNLTNQKMTYVTALNNTTYTLTTLNSRISTIINQITTYTNKTTDLYNRITILENNSSAEDMLDATKLELVTLNNQYSNNQVYLQQAMDDCLTFVRNVQLNDPIHSADATVLLDLLQNVVFNNNILSSITNLTALGGSSNNQVGNISNTISSVELQLSALKTNIKTNALQSIKTRNIIYIHLISTMAASINNTNINVIDTNYNNVLPYQLINIAIPGIYIYNPIKSFDIPIVFKYSSKMNR